MTGDAFQPEREHCFYTFVAMFSVHLERNYKFINYHVRLHKLFQWVTSMALFLLLQRSLECFSAVVEEL